jgi:dye decolorizing peroxidase
VATPAPAHAVFLAFDLGEYARRADVIRLMRVLTDDAERLMHGDPALGDTGPLLAQGPAGLTVSVGFGSALFERIGLGSQRPASVAPLPVFAGDQLERRWSDGDLLVQICSDDATVLSHAARMIVKDTRSFGAVRWSQQGFRSSAGAGATAAGTPRNLLGQVDGSVNPTPGTAAFDDAVWATGPDWFRGGTVMVLRRVRMDLDAWDGFDPEGKDLVLGRRMSDGSPLTGTTESDVLDLRALDGQGFTVIEPNAHISLAKARGPQEGMVRRGYNYDHGPDAQGRPDAGLIFVAYQANADTAFVPVQRRLAANDLMNRWVKHVGSATFAVLPGCAAGEYLGRRLLEG